MELGPPVRIATWNCRQAIDRKRSALDRLGADIVVLQECGAEPAFAGEMGISFLWRGEDRRKGLAIIGFNGWEVEPLAPPLDLPWVLPARIHDPSGAHAFDLLGIWTVLRGDGRPGYAGQIARLAEVWQETLQVGETIVAGDFNCSLQARSGATHGRKLHRLEELGLRSAYHAFNVVAHGAEAAMTLDWIAPGRIVRGYHCDFVLIPEATLERMLAVEVGETREWIRTKLSDHRPVSVALG